MLLDRITLRSTFIFMLSILLSITSASIFSTHAVYAATTKASLPTSVSLGKNLTVQLSNVELFTQEKGLYLLYSLSYTNKGTTSLPLDDYWAKVKTTTGKTFPIKVADKDKNVKTLAGKSSVTVSYYAALDDGITLAQLQLNIIKWDFGVANFIRSLGTFNLAKGYGTPVAAFQTKSIISKELKLKTSIKTVQSSIVGEDRVINVTFILENMNSRDYKATNTQFFIAAADGSLFEAANTGLKDLVVKPKQKKEVTLKAAIPVSVNVAGMKLIMGYQSEADAIFIPIASYQLPKSSATTPESAVNQTMYNNYLIELLGYTRLPSGAQDALTANFMITNKASMEQKVPSLKSAWTINGVSQETKTALVTPLDSRIELAPGESIQLAANISIPYTVNLKDVRITLKEPVDAQNENVIGQFKNSNINQFLASTDQKASFSRLGSKAQVQLLKVRTTEDGKQINLNGDLVVTNLELRAANLQKYGLFVKSANGQIFPLSISDYEGSVIADGRIIVPFSGKIPIAAKEPSMNILITELVPYADPSIKDQPVATNVINIATTWPDSKPNTKFNNLNIGKFDFTFDKVYAYLNMVDFANIQGLNLELEYSMVANPEIDDMAGTYKLRFEIEDQEPTKATFVKEYVLNGKDKTDDFRSGETAKKTIAFSDPALTDKIKTFQNYKFSVYYVVNDEKVLLAQRMIQYFNIQWMQL